jgi:hypothetical protein
LARPPPRRQPATVVPQSQAGARFADASMTPEEPSKRRKGFASLVPEDVPIPTHDEVSNGGLASLKAFSIATLGVFTVFGVSLLALRSYLGINTVSYRLGEIHILEVKLLTINKVDEFAAKMRKTLAKNLPDIDLPPTNSILPAISPESSTIALQDVGDWTWDAAQERLEQAFERDGFTGLLATAAQEMEAERRLERKKWANSS